MREFKEWNTWPIGVKIVMLVWAVLTVISAIYNAVSTILLIEPKWFRDARKYMSYQMRKRHKQIY